MLLIINSDVTESEITREHLSWIYCVDQLYGETFPLTYWTINRYQRKDKYILEKFKFANYHTKYLFGGGNIFMLICKSDKIVVPTILQKYIVNWYHKYLLHTVKEHTETTISKHY